MPDTFLSRLPADLEVLTDAAALDKFRSDASGLQAGTPLLVARPTTVDQVSALVSLCARENRKITVAGGGSGLAGGAAPDEGDVVLSLERLNRIEEIDEAGGTVLVQAGVVLETLCAAVEEKAWYFPLDLGARGSCQIGGNVATNAGGNRVLRYGTTRQLVLGLEVVLPDGTVMTMLDRTLKNNTGLDLKQLFIGTEGSLGIITRVVLRLFPRPQTRRCALVGLASFTQIAPLLKAARGALPELSSFEVMWEDYVAQSAKISGKTVPFHGAWPLTVLIETEGADTPLFHAAFDAFLESVVESGVVQDAILPQSLEQAADLWAIRDGIGRLFPSLRPFVAFDIGIPLKDMAEFIEQAMAELQARWPDAVNLLFGHLGDGNLHLTTGHLQEADIVPVEEAVYALTSRFNGSISAEHGIGRLKKPFLHYSRDEAQQQVMRRIREALNPQGIVNAARIID